MLFFTFVSTCINLLDSLKDNLFPVSFAGTLVTKIKKTIANYIFQRYIFGFHKVLK